MKTAIDILEGCGIKIHEKRVHIPTSPEEKDSLAHGVNSFLNVVSDNDENYNEKTIEEAKKLVSKALTRIHKAAGNGNTDKLLIHAQIVLDS